MTPTGCLLDLDGAWPLEMIPGAKRLDCRDFGPALRYSTTTRWIEAFQARVAGGWNGFTLYGSGDFHHLTAVLLRQMRESFTLVSFDNHPDWDIRPPHWGCGTWMNRALELPHLRQAVVWGCANGELNWPGRLFARRSARLDARPWAERTSASSQRIWRAVSRSDWRAAFSAFAASLASTAVYVTVDMDCLNVAEAVTNWENGLFTAADVAWALRELHRHARLVGGDICGAWSPMRYARGPQKLLAWFDHPRPVPVDAAQALAVNTRTLQILWPALTGGNQGDSGADQNQPGQQAP